MISVCMATYNGEKYISEQIQSILSQLNENDEIIISDDSSTDQTISMIEKFEDSRIKLFKSNTYRSPIYNLENALNNAKGDFIFLADQDDVWLPDKVTKTIMHIRKNNVVMSDAFLCGEDLTVKSATLDSWRTYHTGFIHNLVKPRYLGCCMAFDKRVLEQILPFPINLKAHDVWIGLMAELNGGLTYLPISLIKYRRHKNNFSSAGNKSQNSLVFKLSYRLHFFVHVIFRTCRVNLFKCNHNNSF
jgi:glycosyltransferase involved in cell wall biosynthesis